MAAEWSYTKLTTYCEVLYVLLGSPQARQNVKRSGKKEQLNFLFLLFEVEGATLRLSRKPTSTKIVDCGPDLTTTATDICKPLRSFIIAKQEKESSR